MIIKILDKFGITIVKPLVKRMCPGFEVGARLVVLPALSSGHCSESKKKKQEILNLMACLSMFMFSEI